MSALATTAGWAGPTFKGKPGWEFTPLDGFDLDAFPAAEAGSAEGADLVFSIEPGDLPAGVTVAPLRDGLDAVPVAAAHFGAVARPGFFADLNAAQWTDGTLVHVPAGVVVADPIVVSVVQGEPGTTLHHRTLVVLEDGAEATVFEQLVSAHGEEAVVNGVTELVVGQNAHLHYHAAQEVNDSTWVFGSQRAVVGRDGTLDWTMLGFGGKNGKVFLETTLDGQGSEGKVTGAYAPTGRQHVDYDTLQEHVAPDTNSDLAFRGLITGRSTAVWRGMIKVDEGAQRTDAFQEARNLLIGKKAHADAIPGLEILADDVRCTHAAAIAQIDPEQVFYLRARGLEQESAQRLIVEGFLSAISERYDEGAVRDQIVAAIDARLESVLG